MLVKASKCPADIMQNVSNFIYMREDFRKENLPRCSTPAEIGRELTASDSWFVFADRQPTAKLVIIAVFKLERAGQTAKLSQLCVNNDDSFDSVISGLRREFGELRISNLCLRVRPADVARYAAKGFERGDTYDRFSRTPAESNMIPILPLTSVALKDLSVLAKLMYAAYAKTKYGFPDMQSAEEILRATMSGDKGEYLSNASFASGGPPNLVSACLITADAPGDAKIEQLFTHPLYRARGLATTEIAAGMNCLTASGVKSLSAWDRQSNDVVRRLLTKMGFRQDQTAVEMFARS